MLTPAITSQCQQCKLANPLYECDLLSGMDVMLPWIVVLTC